MYIQSEDTLVDGFGLSRTRLSESTLPSMDGVTSDSSSSTSVLPCDEFVEPVVMEPGFGTIDCPSYDVYVPGDHEEMEETMRLQYGRFYRELMIVCMEFSDFLPIRFVRTESIWAGGENARPLYGGMVPPITTVDRLAFTLVALLHSGLCLVGIDDPDADAV